MLRRHVSPLSLFERRQTFLTYTNQYFGTRALRCSNLGGISKTSPPYGSNAAVNTDQDPMQQQQHHIEEIMDQMVDSCGRPRNPPKPLQLLLPSYQPASHPMILGAASAEPTQCCDNSMVTIQLKDSAQQKGFYSPLWVSEAAASRYELQLKGCQSGTAIRTPYCGKRFIPLSSLKDGGLIDFVGDLRLGGRLVREFFHTDSRILFVRGPAKMLNVSSTLPLHLESTLTKQSTLFKKAITSLQDSHQFLNLSSRKWADGKWLALSDAIHCFTIQPRADGRRALGFGEIMDPAVFVRRHVSASGRKASFRLSPHIGVYYNSEQFSDNKMLINLTKTIIMDNLKSVAMKGNVPETIPRVEARITDVNVDVTIQRLLGELNSQTNDDVKLKVPDDDPSLEQNLSCDRAQLDREVEESALMKDIVNLSREVRESRRRYESQPQMIKGYIGNEATDSDLQTNLECALLEEECLEERREWHSAEPPVRLTSSPVMSASQYAAALENPYAADTAEALDLEASRGFTADDVQDAEDAVCKAHSIEAASDRSSGSVLWLIDPLPPSSAEQLDLAFNEACEATLRSKGCDEEARSSVHEEDETLRIDLDCSRALTADDDTEFAVEARSNQPLFTPISDVPVLAGPLRAPSIDVTPKEAFSLAKAKKVNAKTKANAKKVQPVAHDAPTEIRRMQKGTAAVQPNRGKVQN